VDRVDCHDVLVLGTQVAISDTAHNLGVVIDRELLLAAHVTVICRSGHNQLRQLRPVVRSLSVNATKTLIQAFILCRLDYCNSLLFGISDDYFDACSRCRTLPLGGLAPAYLADDCRLLSDVGCRPLRSNSNDMRKLLVP